MVRSLKRSLVLIVLVCAISGSFLWGRTLADSSRRRHGLHNLSQLLSANAGLGMGDWGGAPAQDLSANVPPAEIYETVLDHVQRDFVEGNLSEAKLSHGALARMLASLDDPKTTFLEPAMCQAQQDALQGRFHGIGAVVLITKSKTADVDYRHLTVVDVMPGGPAEKAGLQPGDQITEINGHWIIAYSPQVDIERIMKENKDDAAKQTEADQVVQKFSKGYNLSKTLPMLVTGEGKPLQLTVERAGQAAPLKVELTTALTEVAPVEYRVVGDHIGYLRVHQFNPKATQAFQEALSKPESPLKGLIVDLRGNPGGVRAETPTDVDGYASARKLIGLLTHGGTVGLMEQKVNRREPLTVATSTPSVTVPLVVLVDHGTANLSELVASALHDTGKAKVIGSPTFGDSILQWFTVLKDGAGIEMATARLFTVGGVDLSKGITPDIPVASPGNPGTDAVLDRALATLGSSA